MVRRRKQQEPSKDIVPARPEQPEIDDRAWSSRRNVPERAARADLVPFMALPAETGPTWAPDQLSIWPVEGGRFGSTRATRARAAASAPSSRPQRLHRVNLMAVAVRDEDEGGATLRLGPLAHSAAGVAIEAFLGRPIEG